MYNYMRVLIQFYHISYTNALAHFLDSDIVFVHLYCMKGHFVQYSTNILKL